MDAATFTGSEPLDQSGEFFAKEETFYDNRGFVVFRNRDGVIEGFEHDDPYGRITARATLEGVESYAYDLEGAAKGNLTEKGGVTLNYDAHNQPHAVRTTSDGRSFDYDAHGNQTLRKGPGIPHERQKLEYTAFDLPRRIEVGPEQAPVEEHAFAYDATNRRVAHDVKRKAGSEEGTGVGLRKFGKWAPGRRRG
jgi:hypothetical protein